MFKSGVGVTYLPELAELFRPGEGLADVVEVEPQTMWLRMQDEDAPYRLNPLAFDRLLALPQSKIVHGVGFPVGSVRAPDERQVPVLAETIRILGAPWASEHLSFNQAMVNGALVNAGFLLPPLCTLSGARAAAASVRSVSSRLPVPFAVETGVSYLRPREGEISDGAFVAAVVEEADCGILLDLHNIWANARNGRQSVEDFLNAIPLERVWELHVAGGFERHGFWLDAHSGAVPAEVMELTADILPRLPNLRAVIFEILPGYVPVAGITVVRKQLECLRELWDRRPSLQPSYPPFAKKASGLTEPQGGLTPLQWEDALGELVARGEARGAFAEELAKDPGVAVLRELCEEARAGMVVDALRFTMRLLIRAYGADAVRAMLRAYWSMVPPQLFGSAEAEAFGAFVAGNPPAVPHINEVLSFELSVIRAALGGEGAIVHFTREPISLLTALAQGASIDDVPWGAFDVLIERGGNVSVKRADAGESDAMPDHVDTYA